MVKVDGWKHENLPLPAEFERPFPSVKEDTEESLFVVPLYLNVVEQDGEKKRVKITVYRRGKVTREEFLTSLK